MQDSFQDLPVIIGSGLSGMAISDWLTRAEIPHLMLGKPPNDLPRLGESIDPAGTLELLRYYPEYKEFYFNKKWISVFLGDYVTACNFESGFTRSLGMRMMGFDSPTTFIHVDRIGFDRAFYQRVTSSDCCRQMDLLVTDVEYDAESDKIQALQLSDGQRIRPRYVFDCTNHIRLLGRSLDIPFEFISEPQRVVFSHYHAPEGTPSEAYFGNEWNHATNILRLYEDMDGMNGLAWAIPLGSYISIGVSIPFDDPDLEPETVLELVIKAYERRGMPISEVFTEQAQVIAIPRQQYFFHERAFGSNWLLAGPSYGQVWFPTSSGVGAALVAGFIAPDILDAPKEVGQAYQDYVIGLQESHSIFDRMFEHHHSKMSHELVRKESNRIVAENVKRVARLALIQNSRLASIFSRLLIKAVSYEGVAVSGCKVYQTPIAEQTAEVFAFN